MFYVYVLQSKKDKGLYIGFTEDLKKRLDAYNKGLCRATKERRPFKLVFYEAYTSEMDARTREKRLKQYKNAYKELMKRIQDCLEK